MPPSLFEEFEKKDELSALDKALLAAARSGESGQIKPLIEEGASLDARHPESGRSPVGIASYFHRHEALKTLLAEGADPDALDARGRAPLMEAVASHCEACMEALLGAGARPDIEDSAGYFPLLAGAEHESPKHSALCVKTLLEAGADVNYQSQLGYFALASSACSGRAEEIEAMIAKGADVNLSDENGFTALHFAIEFKRAEAVAKLLAAGADVRLRVVRKGETLDALGYAERSGHTEIAAMVYAFKELLDLKDGFPALEGFMKASLARKAL